MTAAPQSAQKFTPGPWEVREAATAISVHSLDGRIAAMAIKPTSVHRELGLANAHLIAAAPDLYEALREVMLHLPDFADDDQLAIVKACDQSRAALAKVEGRT